MKAVRTISALSSEAFESRLNATIFELESTGHKISGVQPASGLIKTAVIYFDDNLTYRQREAQHERLTGPVVRITTLVLDLLLLMSAVLAFPTITTGKLTEVPVWAIFLEVVGALLLAEWLNAFIGLSFRDIGLLCVGVTGFMKILPLAMPMLKQPFLVAFSFAFTIACIVVIKPVAKRIVDWYIWKER